MYFFPVTFYSGVKLHTRDHICFTLFFSFRCSISGDTKIAATFSCWFFLSSIPVKHLFRCVHFKLLEYWAALHLFVFITGGCSCLTIDLYLTDVPYIFIWVNVLLYMVLVSC